MAPEITLAGEVTIRGADGERLALRRARARVAFALLTLERSRGVSKDTLAEAVWPAGLPKTWDAALRNVVTEVRAFVNQALPGALDPISASTGRYRLVLPDDVLVDVELAEVAVAVAHEAHAAGDHGRAHELAQKAVEVLRQAFLSDHDAEWVVQQRGRLEQLLLLGLEALSQAAAARGDGATALAAADEVIAREPLRESAHRSRMAAHVVLGNRAEALKAYEHLRRELLEAFGTDPSPETQEAHLALLGPPVAAESRARGDRAHPAAPPPFVGRRAELTLLDRAWNQAVSSRACQVALVTGDTGIGKTRLVQEAVRDLKAVAGHVLFARCERDPTAPYEPFVELLDGYVSALPDDELPRLDAVARAQLATVFPSFDAPPAPTSVPDRTGLFDAVATLVRAATGDGPVAVVLDDLQWADADTLLLLRHLLRRTIDVPLLVVAVTRDPADLAPPLGDALRVVERDRRLHRVPVDGLSEPEVRELVEQLQPETGPGHDPGRLVHLARRLLVDTAGNPFLLVELLQDEVDKTGPAAGSGLAAGTPPVPAGVHGLVEDKLAALGPAGHDLVRAAAVAGTSFDLDLVAAAAGLDETAALDALDEALAARLVAELPAGPGPTGGPAGGPTGGPTGPYAGGGTGTAPSHRYAFTHEIVQRTLYDQLSGPRRRQLHARLADAVEALRTGYLADYTPALAHHCDAAATPGGDLRAVRWSRAAAHQASERRAASETLRLLGQALRHVPADDPGLRAEVLVELGQAQVDATNPLGEQTLLDAALQARRCGRLDVAARAALAVADLAQAGGSALLAELRAEAAALVEDVLAEIEESGSDGAVDRLVHARLVARHLQLGGTGRSGAPGVDRPVLPSWAMALEALREHLATLGGPVHLDQRLALAGELDTVARALDDADHRTIAAHHRTMVRATSGTSSRFEPVGDVDPSAGGGRKGRKAACAVVEQDVALAVTQGRFAEAWSAGERLVGQRSEGAAWWAERGVLPTPGAVAGPQLLVARWLEAPGDEGEESRRDGILRGLGDGQPDDDPAEQALLALVRGERGRARVVARRLANEPESLPTGDRWLHSIGVLALVAVELGDPAIATATYELLAPHAGLACGVGYRSFVGTVPFHLGRLAAVTGDLGEAERHLAAALQQHSDAGARPWIGLTQHALASALEGRGRAYDREWVDVLRGESQSLAKALGLRLPTP